MVAGALNWSSIRRGADSDSKCICNINPLITKNNIKYLWNCLISGGKMKKFYVSVILILIAVMTVNAAADPVQTTKNWISAIFEDGDLKHAFSLLTTEDQTFIKENAPEFYSVVMSENLEELGEFGAIFTALQKIILTTLGKIVKFEFEAGEKVDGGQEVLYSMKIPLDMDFFIRLKDWLEAKEEEFDNDEEVEDPIGKIADAIREFSTLLEGINYKTSFAINDYVTVIKEDGQERISLNMEEFYKKMEILGMND